MGEERNWGWSNQDLQLTSYRRSTSASGASLPEQSVSPAGAQPDAAGITRLLRDDRLRAAISTAGQRSVAESYSWEAIAGRFVALYEQYLPAH